MSHGSAPETEPCGRHNRQVDVGQSRLAPTAMGYRLKLVISSPVSAPVRDAIMTSALARWPFCRDGVPSAGSTRSSVTDGDSARATTINANRSGCDVESAVPAGGPSRSCPIGCRLRRPLACVVDNRLVDASPPAIPWSRQRHTAKIRRACRMRPLCAGGHTGDCSVCVAG